MTTTMKICGEKEMKSSHWRASCMHALSQMLSFSENEELSAKMP
jgi:hypothetical protein